MQRFKNYGFKFLKLLMAVFVIYYLSVNVDFYAIYNSAKEAEFIYILFAFLLLPVNIFLQYLKWKLSCNYFFELNDKKTIASSLFAGFSAAVFTPARIGEYFGRAVELKQHKLVNITAAVFFDKLFTLLWVVLLGLLCLYLAFSKIIYIIVLAAALLISLFIPKLNGITFFRRINNVRILKSVFDFIRTLKIPDRRYSFRMSFYSFLFYGCYLLQFIFLIAAFTGQVNFLRYFYISGSIMFVKTMIPGFITGDIGIRESAAVFFMSQLGESTAAGLNASLLLFLINVVLPSAVGLFPLLRNNK